MKLTEYIDYIKFALTADVLELEISDETIGKAVTNALQEIQRHTNEFRLVEKDYQNCIDMSDVDYYAVAHVYRTKTIMNNSSDGGKEPIDPMYLQFWTSFGLGMTYTLNQYLLNYASYSEMQQIRNTLSTDMYIKCTEDRQNKKLYINQSMGNPGRVVIEYIPLYHSVEDVMDEYWIDYLKRLSLAMVKTILGRLRTYAKQSNALINLDGETLLAEGNEELKTIREELTSNDDYFFPID